MYNQHWIDLVSEVIDWDGLKESAWYFIAHTTDSLSDFAKDQIALFSSITAEDFRDGAFDLAWFQSAYETLGAKNSNSSMMQQNMLLKEPTIVGHSFMQIRLSVSSVPNHLCKKFKTSVIKINYAHLA